MSEDTIKVNMFKESFKKLLLHSEGIMHGERTLIPINSGKSYFLLRMKAAPDRDSILCANNWPMKWPIKWAIWLAN